MRIFISGGCKNGKSTTAEALALSMACAHTPLYYIATMCPVDEEDRLRIVRHQESRSGKGFKTIEMPQNIAQILHICDNDGVFLLDSLTALLANEMFSSESLRPSAVTTTSAALLAILQALPNLVIVSDFIFSDGGVYDDTTEAYRKGLASLDRLCAHHCDTVLEVCYASLVVHKGALPGRFEREGIQ